ncbi:sterol desaturase/sphingolipid hydroxylase (fatty acid hydroxylase superfamily) [Wenyingzhuangia heitensis]|uniref:Sterol desaturase/sphingolipid hydroxylase (Fatty acid hydroxylase superfamily) n=1 Tax=Wenyingzhuangia heitensis TaxID=1487859 RepID=A0ABX0U763_9FLAO|nr:sterol desaturase family protein [Wenyingzhuangia heitensis]NIJ44637.1 sterol desaturase/sphingolipid hydroxylase (fatty acid hydroxylase superfamily) [Wenyingzhuangia heitensis]
MNTFLNSFINTLSWLYQMISFQTNWYENYFWGLILISLIVWSLEILFPWRKQQSIFRQDFWLDGFYMFFNFFLFSIFISGFYAIFSNLLAFVGLSTNSLAVVDLKNLAPFTQLLIFFVLSDFFQWFTHVMLHRFDALWSFHQVHHSVKEMGFAAHLRYHWIENILYKPLKTLAIMLLGGFEPEQAYLVHFIAISIGHLNHSNLNITWGPLKYIFNNPVMHLYHHAYHLPKDKKYGVNFGISLSLWDYIFRTNYIPKVDKNELLGFKGDDKVPSTFWKQLWVGFKN